MDDPSSPTIYRVSGDEPFPDPRNPSLPESIVPRQVTLRDRQTVATILPFVSKDQVPSSLLLYLSDQFKKEVEGGDTYPMIDPMPFEQFASYWFQNFAGIMVLGSIDNPEDLDGNKDWSKQCLGSFYIKPNYPGRSSHICNAGFLVTDASRGRGVGRLMGESYLDWAPKLGYIYSVFNLVYETNVASCKIWDALGFKRIGRVPRCGRLKSHPDRLVDAIIYGRDLAVGESEELVSEERFDKIKFYLKYGKYPNGADRAEKSRLRSAATHYKLLEGDKLMLKDKEVISDPERQYKIAREVHLSSHGGINKTTATIAERYHWSRIKETVSDVIRNCTECKELGKTPAPNGTTAAKGRPGPSPSSATKSATSSEELAASTPSARGVSAAGRRVPLREGPQTQPSHQSLGAFTVPSGAYPDPEPMTVMSPGQTLHTPTDSPIRRNTNLPGFSPMLDSQPAGVQRHHERHQHSVYQPIDPQIIGGPPYMGFHAETFQGLLNATDDDVVDPHQHHHHHHHTSADEDRDAAVDQDIDMLINHQDDEEEDAAGAGMDVEGDTAAGKMDIGRLLNADAEERRRADIEFGGGG
jgi:GNAT superfamily N-acetyltransferase